MLPANVQPSRPTGERTLADVVDAAERQAIEAALREHDGSREKAAEALATTGDLPGPARLWAHEEGEALNEIVFAGNNIKEVLAFDGDDPSVKVAPDMNWDDHAGRLRTAQEFLRRAHDDLFSEPDNPVSRELRGRAAGHIENASRWTAAAIQRWHF